MGKDEGKTLNLALPYQEKDKERKKAMVRAEDCSDDSSLESIIVGTVLSVGIIASYIPQESLSVKIVFFLAHCSTDLRYCKEWDQRRAELYHHVALFLFRLFNVDKRNIVTVGPDSLRTILGRHLPLRSC